MRYRDDTAVPMVLLSSKSNPLNANPCGSCLGEKEGRASVDAGVTMGVTIGVLVLVLVLVFNCE